MASGLIQLVLIRKEACGLLALEIVLDGAIECAGVLGVDIPDAPLHSPISPTMSSVRLVFHEGQPNGNSPCLREVLRANDIDTRVTMLPPRTGNTDDDATFRATKTFLGELIAKACRKPAREQRS